MENEIKLNFGKHQGKLINEIPMDYLVWCFENIMDFIENKQPEFYDYLVENQELIFRYGNYLGGDF